MQKEFYEYIYSLRASGFMHHTWDDMSRLFDESATSENNVAQRSMEGTPIGQGERGSLSQSRMRDIHNYIVGCCFIASNYAVERGADAEYAYGLSDYYINQLDKVHSVADYKDLFCDLTQAFQDFMTDQETLMEAKKNYPHAIRSAINYISQHLYSSLTVADVAEHAGLESSYLSSLFKKETGLSLKQYILAEKIKETKKMLVNTDQPLSEIGEALGFSSAPHFTKVFKEYAGMTPSRYRDKNR